MSPYWKPIVNIKRDNDKLTLFALNHARVVSDFLIALQDGLSKGFESFSLIFDSEIRGAYPNTCAPLAGIIEYYKKQGIDIYSEAIPEFIEVTYLLSPLKVSENENILKQAPLNKVWRFENSSDINSSSDLTV